MPTFLMKDFSRKIKAFLLVSIMLSSCIFPVHANQHDSENGIVENTTAQENGFTNVSFSNGYKGYCIDRYKKGAEVNQVFKDAESTVHATNNVTGSDISQKLKILFTQCFETIFTDDSNGGYTLNPNMESPVSFAIYHFAGEQSYIWAENKALVQTVNSYSGPAIPDHGYQINLNNGDIITFDFAVFIPDNSDTHQRFFAYKLSTEHKPSHEHSYSETWSYDETGHWHECECGNKTNEAPHDEEIRDYVAPEEFKDGYSGDTYCKDCDKLLQKGNALPQTHVHDYSDDWKSDDDNHWHECECGDRSDESTHIREVHDCVDPGEFQEGYTGDIYCKVCNKLLSKGESIPQTHKHSYSDSWASDEDSHWYECKCGDTQNLDKHKGGKGTCVTKPICDICKKPVGSIDTDNHTGNIEIRNAKEATENEAGYTGDTYCKDCDELLKKGDIILPKPIMPSEPQETTPPATEPTENPSNPSTEPTLPSEPIEETKPSTEPIQPITKPEIPQETQTPTTPVTKPTSSAKPDQAIPETGDAANIVPFLILMLVSGTIISIITPKLWNRRKSK